MVAGVPTNKVCYTDGNTKYCPGEIYLSKDQNYVRISEEYRGKANTFVLSNIRDRYGSKQALLIISNSDNKPVGYYMTHIWVEIKRLNERFTKIKK